MIEVHLYKKTDNYEEVFIPDDSFVPSGLASLL